MLLERPINARKAAHQPPTVQAGALDQLTRHKATAPTKSHLVSSPQNTTQMQNKYTQIRQKKNRSNEALVPGSRVISSTSYNPTNTSATLINTTTPRIQCKTNMKNQSNAAGAWIKSHLINSSLCLPPAHLARWATKVTSQGE